MSQKAYVWLGMWAGSFIGAFTPRLWGDGIFSTWGVLLTGVGGFLGIFLGFQLSQRMSD